MLRLSVLGMIGAAALLLIKPINQPSVSFIDWKSWLIFAVACVLTISPLFVKKLESNGKSSIVVNKCMQIISNPILLIILAGFVGYLIYL
jgi:surface polysaccharide O-acyltransferase-like enzyme